MPLPIGANARDTGRLARWTLLLALALILICLWWPSLQGWAVWMVTTLGLWMLWLVWRTVEGSRRVPGHWINLAMLGAVAVLGYHVSHTALGRERPSWSDPAGEIDLTMAVQLAGVALWVLLSQDLLRGHMHPRLVPTLIGGSAAAGSLVGLTAGAPEQGRLMVALLGWAGVTLFVWPLWRGSDEITRWYTIVGKWARLLTALLLAVLLAWHYPPALPVLALLAAVTLLLWGLWQAKWRWWVLLAALACATMVLAVRFEVQQRVPGPLWPFSLSGWVGQGEQAMGRWNPWEGLPWLIGSLGWLTVLWMGLGLLLGWSRAMRFVRPQTPREHLRAMLWTFTAVIISAAWVAPGGLYSPAVTTLFAFVWAMLPQRLGEPVRMRSGWWVLAAVMVISVLAGLAHRDGLLAWTANAFNRQDSTMHFITGLLVTQIFLWLLGGARWGVVLAVVGSLAASVLGELAQGNFSTRNMEAADALCHAGGAAVALAIFLLCRGSLGCESRDVTAKAPESMGV